MGVRARPSCQIGPVLGPTSAPDATTQDHAKPNLRPNVQNFRNIGPPVGLKLGPSWSQVGANWPELGASYAQVGPKSALVRPNIRSRTAKFDPRRLVLGPSRPASFLSALFPECGHLEECWAIITISNMGWNTEHYQPQ